MKKIVSISGTSRPDNFTSLALAVVTDELRRNDIEVVVIDARELNLSFPGYPETEDAVQLRDSIKSADGVVLATPEYHGSFCAMTKLIIENLGFPSAFSNKPVALLGVAGGRIGAIKSLEQLRGVCAHTGAIVLPNAISIAGVRSAFDKEGNCTDPGTEKALRGLAQSLLRFLKEYVYPKHALEEMVRENGALWSASV
ncbi:MAG: NAD(P)H-dependent oxidoreductase [Phaeodactylibacter sp.]|nr:NAD(P)H-dependent oxidoreductase [Phaeodactylibacter sp.]